MSTKKTADQTTADSTNPVNPVNPVAPVAPVQAVVAIEKNGVTKAGGEFKVRNRPTMKDIKLTLAVTFPEKGKEFQAAARDAYTAALKLFNREERLTLQAVLDDGFSIVARRASVNAAGDKLGYSIRAEKRIDTPKLTPSDKKHVKAMRAAGIAESSIAAVIANESGRAIEDCAKAVASFTV